MKKWFCLLMTLLLLPISGASAENAPAAEHALVLMNGKTAAADGVLSDGMDDTGVSFKRGRTATLSIIVPEGETGTQLYLRMTSSPSKLTMKCKNAKNRWEETAVWVQPGAECVLTADFTGEVRLEAAFDPQAALTVTEARLFGAGTLPDGVRAWQTADAADVLLVFPDEESIDHEAVRAQTAAGRSVAVALVTAPENSLAVTDALWADGVRMQTAFGDCKAAKAGADEAAVRKAWGEKAALSAMTHWVRLYQPLLLLTPGEASAACTAATALLTTAAANASITAYNTEDAAACGLWVVPEVRAVSAEAGELAERSQDAIRAMCVAEFADAAHSDPAAIPYPADRLADGYLASGEFVFEDEEAGLWAYLSETVQVEIVRWEVPEIPRVWFVTDVQFKPDSEQFKQVKYVKASFEDQQTYPETLAQNAGLVLGINGDYYPYRVRKGTAVGNILRNGKVLYNMAASDHLSYPILDTMALRDDGTLSVYGGHEVTASALAAEGGVHDALSFGPYLVRGNALRIYTGSSYDHNEPRNAIGMVSAGHYRIVTVEGRIPKGPAGVDLNTLARLLYAQGVSDGFNLDGGNTSVLVFLGTKLNRTGAKVGTGLGSPRNMHELFGVGTTEQVHTDMLNGK